MEQRKEPAFSRDLRKFFNVSANNVTFDASDLPGHTAMTGSDIIEVAKRAKIVDERDGLPLFEKLMLARDSGVLTVVADASDDEPYISSQINPLLKKSELAVTGLRFVQKATGAKNIYFAVYKNITDVSLKIPRKIEDVELRRVRGRYPADYRILEEFSNCRPVLLIGVCSLLHLTRAMLTQKVQTTCFLTVAGNCVSEPSNLEVSQGMPIMQVLERCGLSRTPKSIIVGGSMTGITCRDPDNTVVTTATRAILAFSDDDKDSLYRCIGCGRCVDVCPENLTPVYLYKCITHDRARDLNFYEIDRCIGCGTCSYICPAKLDLAAAIKRARSSLPAVRKEVTP